MKKITLLLLAAAAIVIIGTAIKYLNRPAPQPNALDNFAQCLRDKGAVMYGADWCPHCQNEKKAFGSSWRFINYIECPKEPRKCLAANINGYPTWIFPDGRRFEGELGLQTLSLESACALTTAATTTTSTTQ